MCLSLVVTNELIELFLKELFCNELGTDSNRFEKLSAISAVI